MMKNLGQMMKQVQELQERMQAVQAKLENLSIEGRAGGGLVQVTLNGKGAMIALALDESLLKPGEKEILEDLMIAAHADARNKMEALVAEEMKELTGGLPMPPGFQMPF
jgi:nucleoid-associated protein EbfC